MRKFGGLVPPRLQRVRTFVTLLPNIDEARSFKDRAMEGHLKHQSGKRECAMVWYELMRSRQELAEGADERRGKGMPVNVALPSRYAETASFLSESSASVRGDGGAGATGAEHSDDNASGRLRRYSSAAPLRRSRKTLKRRNAESF